MSEPKINCRDRGYNFDTGIECDVADCGGTLCIADNADGLIYDSDEYECEECGVHGAMHVYPDDDGKPQVVAGEIENQRTKNIDVETTRLRLINKLRKYTHISADEASDEDLMCATKGTFLRSKAEVNIAMEDLKREIKLILPAWVLGLF